MKNVIILAYDFPPNNSMGSLRPYAWYKYFHEFNLHPVVITRHWDDSVKSFKDGIKPSKSKSITINTTSEGTIINVPHEPNFRDKLILKYGLNSFVIFRKIISVFYLIFEYTFFKFDNKKGIYYAADEYIKEHGADLIIATGEPFILFRYASKLSKKHSIPWIADYRDYWSMDINLLTFNQKIIYKLIYAHFERKFVESASLITTVSPLNMKLQKEFFPNKKVEIIYNGYFEEKDYNFTKNDPISETFTVAYGGTIYLFNPLENFIEGVKLFIEKDPSRKCSFNFYGSNYDPDQKERIIKCTKGLERFIILTDKLSKEELFLEYKKASCLLIFNYNQMIPGKLFEYLPMKRKILMAGNDHGPIESIINNTNSGIICDSPENIANTLDSMYLEWKSTGLLKNEAINIEKYTRRNQTQNLAKLIHKQLT